MKEDQLGETIALVRACGCTFPVPSFPQNDAADETNQGTIDTGSSTPRTPTPPITCPHRALTTNNANNATSGALHSNKQQNRYSTSSLPCARGDCIEYADTGARRRPHTADEVFGIGKGKRLRRRETEIKPLVMNIQDLKVRKHEDEARVSPDDGGLDAAKDATEADSLASSGILSDPSMAVSCVQISDVSTEVAPPLTMTISISASSTPSPTDPASELGRRRTAFRPQVSVLESKIAVIGLNKHTERQWEHRVQVFLNFPEEQARHSFPPSTEREQPTTTPRRRPFISYIRTEEGTSLCTEIPLIRSLFPQEEDCQSLVQSGGELGMFDSDDDLDHTETHGRDTSSASCSSSARSRAMTSDSGYGSAFSTPWIEPVEYTMGPSLDPLDGGVGARTEKRPERGVKRCLQLDFRSPQASVKGEYDDGLGTSATVWFVALLTFLVGVDQTKLIAKISGRLQRQGLGLL